MPSNIDGSYRCSLESNSLIVPSGGRGGEVFHFNITLPIRESLPIAILGVPKKETLAKHGSENHHS